MKSIFEYLSEDICSVDVMQWSIHESGFVTGVLPRFLFGGTRDPARSHPRGVGRLHGALSMIGQMILESYAAINCDIDRLMDPLSFKEAWLLQGPSLEPVRTDDMSVFWEYEVATVGFSSLNLLLEAESRCHL